MNTQTDDSAFIRACRRQPVPSVPVWYMRQAGRSLPEYRATRAGMAMLDACSNPELITEITLQPVRRYGVDAAILFSDIVLPLKAAGLDIDIRPGVGPQIDKPFRDDGDVAKLRDLEPGDVDFVSQAVGMLTAELGGTPLIGFAGGPFTLACYLVDGGPSKTFDQTRALMYGNPELWRSLLARLTAITITFLQVQVSAGASAVQLFDSWAGILSPEDYRRGVLPYSKQILAAIAASGVPSIHFGVGTGELLGLLGEAALQGNLDPAVLLAPWPVIEERARDVVRKGRTAESHIFNLGHGVLPDTDPDVLARLTDLVHSVPTGSEGSAGSAGPAG